ncbi:asparaginase [Halorubrum amylolyticum]|uniref:asparaginase n=1 Tax=Halorubrum amylolyticum TaxID=2508724 RepID=UPI0010093464|nr:asparaginase [Halorubrum amylolyticum]
MSSIHIVATGGTIAGTDGGRGVSPSRSGRELIERVPQLSDRFDITVTQVTQRPSSELSTTDLTAIAKSVRRVAEAADGVVVLHGTDTMAETAYYLDLVAGSSAPVVLTGSQRTAADTSPDGSANLVGAVEVAAHDEVETGAYVFFNDRLHAARAVRKRHASNLAAYDSGHYGLVAERVPDGLWFYRRPRSLSATLPATELTARVRLVTTSTGTDGSGLRHAVDRGVDGLVVEGLGMGNVPPDVAAALETATDAGVRVVVTSRCIAGTTAPVYGGRGGAAALAETGAILGGTLPAHKARIALLAALSAPEQIDVAALFDPRTAEGHGLAEVGDER